MAIAVVGLLALADAHEREDLRAELFAPLDDGLLAAGYDGHVEPELPASATLELDLGEDGTLQAVRRLAVHLVAHRQLPRPWRPDRGDPGPELDPALAHAYDSGPVGGPFDHLVHHSDVEGVWVPQDLRSPLDLDVPGGTVGSSLRLVRECAGLAGVLDLPAALGPDAPALAELLDAPVDDGERWQVYGAESYALRRLWAAAERSVATGAALVLT